MPYVPAPSTDLRCLYGLNFSSTGNITIRWTVVPGVTQHKVYKSLDQNGQYNFIGNAIVSGEVASYSDTSPVENTFNYYRVSSVLNGVESELSEEVYIIPKLTPNPNSTEIDTAVIAYHLLYDSTNQFKSTAPRTFKGKNKFYAKYLDEIMHFLLAECDSYYTGVSNKPKFWVYSTCDDFGGMEMGFARTYDPVNNEFEKSEDVKIYRRDYAEIRTLEGADLNFIGLYLRQIQKFLDGCLLNIMCTNRAMGSELFVLNSTYERLHDRKACRGVYQVIAGSSTITPLRNCSHSIDVMTKECGVPDWALNEVRPTYPAAAITNDGNFMFFDLLRAKAEKKITDRGLFGKFSILRISPLGEVFNPTGFNFETGGSVFGDGTQGYFFFYRGTQFIIANSFLHPLYEGNTSHPIGDVRSVASNQLNYFDTDGKECTFNLRTGVESQGSNALFMIRGSNTAGAASLYLKTKPYIAQAKKIQTRTKGQVGGYPGDGVRTVFWVGSCGFILDNTGNLYGCRRYLGSDNQVNTTFYNKTELHIYPKKDDYIPGTSFLTYFGLGGFGEDSYSVWLQEPSWHTQGFTIMTVLDIGTGTGLVIVGDCSYNADGSTNIFPFDFNYEFKGNSADPEVTFNTVTDIPNWDPLAVQLQVDLTSDYWVGDGGTIKWRLNGDEQYSYNVGRRSFSPGGADFEKLSCGPPASFNITIDAPIYMGSTSLPSTLDTGFEHIALPDLYYDKVMEGSEFAERVGFRDTRLAWNTLAFAVDSTNRILLHHHSFKFITKIEHDSEITASSAVLDFCPEPNVKVTPIFEELTLVRRYAEHIHRVKVPNYYYHEEVMLIGDPELSDNAQAEPLKKRFISAGIFEDASRDDHWSIEGGSADTTVDYVEDVSDRVCEVTTTKKMHTPFNIVCKDDWMEYTCPDSTETEYRTMKTRAKVWPRTLPKGVTNGIPLYVIGVQNVLYDTYVKLGDINIATFLGVGGIVADGFRRVNYGYKTLVKFYGVGVGRTTVTLAEKVHNGTIFTHNGKTLTFDVEVWEPKKLTSGGSLTDLPTELEVGEELNLDIDGVTSNPVHWSVSDPDVVSITVDPQDNTLATITAKAAGTFYFTVSDSAQIPWISGAITVE